MRGNGVYMDYGFSCVQLFPYRSKPKLHSSASTVFVDEESRTRDVQGKGRHNEY